MIVWNDRFNLADVLSCVLHRGPNDEQLGLGRRRFALEILSERYQGSNGSIDYINIFRHSRLGLGFKKERKNRKQDRKTGRKEKSTNNRKKIRSEPCEHRIEPWRSPPRGVFVLGVTLFHTATGRSWSWSRLRMDAMDTSGVWCCKLP